MKSSLLYVAFLIGILPLAGTPLEAQQLSEEAIKAMLESRQFEIGGTRITEPASREEERPAEDGRDEAEDLMRALLDATKAVGAAGAPMDVGEITGFAKSLLGAATGGTGGLPLSSLGTLGQTLTGSALDAASAFSANGSDRTQFPGAGTEGVLQQIGSMLEASRGVAGTPTPVPAANSLDNARALLDAYNAARAGSASAATGTEERAPAQSTTRVNARVQPSPGRTPARNNEEREPLPWAASSRGASRDDATGDEPAAPARVRATRSVPNRAAPAEATASPDRPPVTSGPGAADRENRSTARRDAESATTRVGNAGAIDRAPERYRDLLDGVPSYEDAVAEREGDWFVVLGSYGARAGAALLPSPAVEGSVGPSASASIARVQQQLWEAGYVPYVVRSDAIPSFRSGLTVILLGPLTRSDAAAELPALREIVSDAYIKAGW